jgi:hypothetical protein
VRAAIEQRARQGRDKDKPVPPPAPAPDLLLGTGAPKAQA